MIRSPVFRISLGLVMLTLSSLLFGQLLGVVPDTRQAELESRKIIAESLAVQVSAGIVRDNQEAATATIRAVVSRNDTVVSVGVRRADELMLQAGNHAGSWQAPRNDKSTATNVVVPLYEGGTRWGSLEVHFRPLGQANGGVFRGSFLTLLLFVSFTGLILNQLFLRRVLRELNPDAVIPERVRTALDTLAEGVLILDAKEQMVFANQSFVTMLGTGQDELLGQPVEHLKWRFEENIEPPWVTVLRGDANPGAVPLTLITPVGDSYSLVVNASPITAGTGQHIRGVLATFDDVTQLERANDELRHALSRLENNEKEIRRQNCELQVLATRDPLTGCLNRRSLFQGFETLVADAIAGSTPLACVMVDVDHFKSVNDRFGHTTGDKVLKRVSALLVDGSGADDLVGRYGGEEFCLVMPGKDAAAAAAVAEELRMELSAGRESPAIDMLTVTASFGVSELSPVVSDHTALIDRADQALYRAKENGRNRTQIDTQANSIAPAPGEAPDPAAVAPPAVRAEPTTAPELEVLRARVLELEKSLAKRTNEEPLERVTGLPGRLLLVDRATQAIERAKRYRHHVAALALSLDALPRVRDALGDLAAEGFREKAVATIKTALRATDTVGVLSDGNFAHSVARLDSEKIGLLLTDIEDIDLLPRVVQRLQNALTAPQEVAGNEISQSADIGISIYPGDCLDAVTMLRHAGAAVHEAAREPGRNRSRFYAPEINARSKHRLRLESDLYRAIERQEFQVHYQPKVDLNTGAITGMEALLRWQNPRTGLVPPVEFIGVAEQIGCMDAISDQTIGKVCHQIRVWRDAGLGDIPIAVNLSPVEFRDPNLPDRILARVAEAGIDASLLEVEITESLVMESEEAAAHMMHQLHNAGVKIAIDDFGTGYSTLRCLTQFPVSKIKIDRSFLLHIMDDEQNAAVVTGVTSLAHTLGLTVIAEGVESAEQLSYLRDLQCHEVQGYYLSRAVPADAARALLENPVRIRSLIVADEATPVGQDLPVSNQLLGLLNPVRSTVD